MVSTRLPTSKSSNPFSKSLVTVPNAPIISGIIVTCMFHIFFYSLAKSRYLSFFSHSFSFILWLAGTAKSTILQVLFFLLTTIIIIIIIIIIICEFFFRPLLTDGFYWSLNDSKSQLVFRNLLRIFADLVLWFGWSRFFLWPSVPPVFFQTFGTVPRFVLTV